MSTILITGGSRGIGRALVTAFAADQSNKIVFTYRTSIDEARAIERAYGDSGRIRGIKMDLLDQASIQAGLTEALAQIEGFDIVIHNAGSCDDTPFFFMEEKQWTDVIQTSLNSFFYINKAVLPHMISNRYGRIVVMASVSGESGNRGQTNYSAAKGALIAASKSLAKEVARKGVLVNVVSPGLIETDMTKNVHLEQIKDLIPVGRMGRAEEVAAAVLFLASPAASYINGTILQVNGGLYT